MPLIRMTTDVLVYYRAWAKVFEGVIIDQLGPFLENVYSPCVSDCRKNYGCKNVLLRFLKRCKWSVDSNSAYGPMLPEMSKVFVFLPHRLLVSEF